MAVRRPALLTPVRRQAALPYLAAAFIALPAGLHLLQAGFWVSGDGMHHLHRVAVLTSYLEQGVLYPRWIGEFSFRYGAPVFNFYSPLSYYLAQIFAPLGPLWAMKLTMLGGLLASAALMYHFVRQHTGLWPALGAVAVYSLLPYRFVDLYPRAALAEHMAFLWLPLILWAFDGLWTNKRAGWQVIGWVGLVLTHSFTALMFAPFFGLYLAWQAAARREWRPLLRAVLPLALAVLITAFFWLPLGLEAKHAGLGASEVGEGYRNHLIPLSWLPGPLLFDYTTGGDRPDYYFAFGLLPTVLLGLTVVFVVAAKRSKFAKPRGPNESADPDGWLPAFGLVSAVLALLLITRVSTPIWQAAAPVLANIQFPWRFLSIATLGAALAVTGPVSEIRGNRWQALAVAGLVIALYGTSAGRMPFEPQALAARAVTPEQLWAFDRETGQAGTTWGGEFLPNGVTEQRWALGRAAERPVDGPAMPAVEVGTATRRGDGYRMEVNASQPWTFRHHAFYFPGWQVRVDGKPVATNATGDMGLVTAEVPSGSHTVSVTFERTGVRKAAVALMVTGVLSAMLLLLRQKRLVGLLPLALGLLAGVSPLLVKEQAIQPVRAVFGDQAQLIGVELPERASSGEDLVVDLLWLASRQVATNDKAFVHVVDAGGTVVAQSDSDPGGGFTPTTRWQPGELVPDRHRIALPEWLPPGEYRVMAGLYRFEPFRNLLTEPANVDGRVVLGVVKVQ